jgi:CheY-like chemotaxis protein
MSSEATPRIVFIDDNQPNNVFSRIVIEMDNIPLIPISFTVSTEAIDYLQECHDGSSGDPFPDYVVLDLNMPQMDGFSFIRNFEERFAKEHPQTRLFIMSTTKRMEDEAKALEFASVFGFFEKPFSKEIADQIIGPAQ